MSHEFNGAWSGANLTRSGFPLGGFGTGMIALEGSGKLGQVSLRHRPDIGNEPLVFSAIHVRGVPHGTRVLEGPAPDYKRFTGFGHYQKTYGSPLFEATTFSARFPFATVDFAHSKLPLKCSLRAFNPFVPGDADASSLPVASLEYSFTNTSDKSVEAVYSFNSKPLVSLEKKDLPAHEQASLKDWSVIAEQDGFVFVQPGGDGAPAQHGEFAACCDAPETTVDCAWFRGGWFDTTTMLMRKLCAGDTTPQPPHPDGKPSAGASLFVPFKLAPGETRTLRVLLSWYVPFSRESHGLPAPQTPDPTGASHYRPWYAARFTTGSALREYWRSNHRELERKSRVFSDAFHATTLPPEVMEAVSANLSILKSPTVMRQLDGRFWGWEGCHDASGCCHGTCTHVWNYAQAVCHLQPELERSLRETEFTVSQSVEGHQTFRTPLPIAMPKFDYHAASDGQLGGIMKLHRDWRISGDTAWLRTLYPSAVASIEYCIRKWDPDEQGLLVEPHHNTYDIEFWGPDGMCTSFYIGALKAMSVLSQALGKPHERYEQLYQRGKLAMEEQLFNGEYFIQKVQWQGLKAKPPQELTPQSYSREALAILEKEGPKYQYGAGCLSDGVLGAWIAKVCGLGDILDVDKVRSHLKSVVKYNFRESLVDHVNPQRSGYAEGNEGGLITCSWPKGGRLALPFPYSEEVFTGIEYQVASHLMMLGEVEDGLKLVRAARSRYDGVRRSPFNEIECGHFYARALASYGLLQGLTGIRYDAVTQTLSVEPSIAGDFTCFLSTATGFGVVKVQHGTVSVDVAMGAIDVKTIDYIPAKR